MLKTNKTKKDSKLCIKLAAAWYLKELTHRVIETCKTVQNHKLGTYKKV